MRYLQCVQYLRALVELESTSLRHSIAAKGGWWEKNEWKRPEIVREVGFSN